MVKITINDNVAKLKEKSKAKNTQDKYEGDWLKFTSYCQNKYLCNPLDVDDLESAYALTANYMDWLHEDPEAKVFKGSSNIPGREKLNNNPYSSSPYKASTIQRILASITYKYRLNGFQFDSEMLIKAAIIDSKVEHIRVPTIYDDQGSAMNNFTDTIKFIRMWIMSYFWT